MAEFEQDVAESAAAFGGISSQAAQASNARRRQIADMNIRAGTQQIRMQNVEARNQLARSLNEYKGQQAAARAFRGTEAGAGVGTGAAAIDRATAATADQAAIAEANAAAQEASLVASQQFIEQDPIQAAIQGGVQGLQFGTQIASALLQEGEVETRQRSTAIGINPLGGTEFENTITSFLDIPGLDLGEMFGDFLGD